MKPTIIIEGAALEDYAIVSLVKEDPQSSSQVKTQLPLQIKSDQDPAVVTQGDIKNHLDEMVEHIHGNP